MGILSDIIGGSANGLISGIGNVVDKFHFSKEEKAEVELKKEAIKAELAKLVQARDSELEQTLRAEVGAKERIMVAELQHGDKYTKRARPTIVYTGLAVIVYNFCIVPTIQMFMQMDLVQFNLPGAFWTAWGSICGLYAIGRSAQHVGMSNKVVELMAGKKKDATEREW
jgi:hypothetical protein